MQRTALTTNEKGGFPMTSLPTLIALARQNQCSDLHLTPGLPPVFRLIGRLEYSDIAVTPEETEALILSMTDDSQRAALDRGEDLDFTYVTPDGSRQRVNIYRQREQLCAAIRIINTDIPTLEQLGMPPVLQRLAGQPRGLVLVTGPTGSGKSTTLAAMIDYISARRRCHILTIEDPIEYLYPHKQAMIHQRELGSDVSSFAGALRSAMREDPDVILVGEMRDYETISAAVTAAETGHLVLSTLHTTGAAKTIDRIIDVFPTHSQGQIRTQLSGVLRGIITQQLLPDTTGSGRVAALEVLIGTDAVLSLIRDNKCHQLGSAMQTGARDGMQTLNVGLADLVRSGRITREAAMDASSDPRDLEQYL